MRSALLHKHYDPENCALDLPSVEIIEEIQSPWMMVDNAAQPDHGLSSPGDPADEGANATDDENSDESDLDKSAEECSPLVIYLKAVSRIPLLSEAREQALAKRIKECEKKCTHLAIQWRHLFKNNFLKVMSATRRREITTALERMNGASQFFDDLPELERKRRGMIRALQRLVPGSKSQEEVQEALYRMEADISKCIAKMSLGGATHDGLIEHLQEVLNGKKHKGTRQAVGRTLQGILKQAGTLSEEIKALKKEFVSANQRLVICIAKKYAHQGLALPDLIQEGNLGLIRAVDTFDYQRGPRFITYASWWIRQAMMRALACQARTVRIPVYMSDKAKQITKISNRLLHERKRKPSLESIAQEADAPPESIEKIMGSFYDTIPLDGSTAERGNGAVSPALADPASSVLGRVIASDVSRCIDHVLSDLALREREVVKLRYGIGDSDELTLEEIGDRFSLSRERIRQILEEALRKLRAHKQVMALE